MPEITYRFKRGDDWTADRPVDVLVNGLPQDFTVEGWSTMMQLRPYPNSSTVFDCVLDEAQLALSKVLPGLPSETTATIPPRVYMTDVQITDPDGNTVSSETFYVEVVADVSRTPNVTSA